MNRIDIDAVDSRLLYGIRRFSRNNLISEHEHLTVVSDNIHGCDVTGKTIGDGEFLIQLVDTDFRKIIAVGVEKIIM